MKAYPLNSPQAAARVLAMALVADGQYSATEIRALDRQNAPGLLGLTPQAFKEVMDDFCMDLLQHSQGQWSGVLDAEVRSQVLADITDCHLQDLILQQCEALMLADGHLADGEVSLLDALGAAWRKPVLI